MLVHILIFGDFNPIQMISYIYLFTSLCQKSCSIDIKGIVYSFLYRAWDSKKKTQMQRPVWLWFNMFPTTEKSIVCRSYSGSPSDPSMDNTGREPGLKQRKQGEIIRRENNYKKNGRAVISETNGNRVETCPNYRDCGIIKRHL